MPALMMVLVLLAAAAAQQPPQATGGTPPANAPATATQKSPASCAKGALQAAAFTDATADCILGAIQQGLVTHNSRQIIAVFDKKQFDGYETFPDQLEAMFERYPNIRAGYQIASTKVEGDHATLLVDFDVEERARGDASPPVRRRERVRFEVARGTGGWKVVDYMPRGFFA